MSRSRAIVIGGGVAGLAAALRLAETGRFDPTVLEREPEPGGLARSLHFKGLTTDLGPHRIHTELPEVQKLIRRVAAPSLLTVRRHSRIFLRGGFISYPPRPLAMAAHLGSWRLARFMTSYFLEQIIPARKPETYESLMRRAFGKALYDFLLRPYSAKTWKIDPAQLHADTARVRVSAGSLGKMIAGLLGRSRVDDPVSLKQFLYVRGGIETLVRHLKEQAEAAGARIELEREVVGLDLDARGRVATVRSRRPGANVKAPEKSWEADVVLSTVPLPALVKELLPSISSFEEARRAASGLGFLDILFVMFVVRRASISEDTWLYFPEPHLIFNRAYEAKNFDPSMVPNDRSILCVEITHRPGDAVASESDAALIQTVREQIASTGLLRADEIADAFVYRLPFAYPLYTLDYAERVERVFAGLRRIPNLITFGRQGLFIHDNMDHSIYMGLRAAELLAEHGIDEATARWYDGARAFRSMRIVD